jgi:hypothetical protein
MWPKDVETLEFRQKAYLEHLEPLYFDDLDPADKSTKIYP